MSKKTPPSLYQYIPNDMAYIIFNLVSKHNIVGYLGKTPEDTLKMAFNKEAFDGFIKDNTPKLTNNKTRKLYSDSRCKKIKKHICIGTIKKIK